LLKKTQLVSAQKQKKQRKLDR